MKKPTKYYEATLQLRPKKEELLDFVINQTEERKDVSISEIFILKTGYDVYLTSQKYAQTIARKLKVRFKGSLKVSRKLYGFSKKKGKLVYRLTICFRLK